MIRTVTKVGGSGGASVEWGPDFGVDQSVVQAALLPVSETLAYTGPIDQSSFTTLEWSAAYVQPKKDCTSHTDVPIPDPNLNGLDLTTSTVAATLEDAYIAWDVRGTVKLPTNLTVTSGTLKVVIATVQAGAATIDIFGIADVDEGWGETTINGASHPARSGASKQQFTVANGATAGTVVTVALNSTVLSYLQGKVTGDFATATLILAMNTGLTTSVFRDRENVANTPPLLTLVFTTPTT